MLQDCTLAQVNANSSDYTVGRESKVNYLSQSPREAECELRRNSTFPLQKFVTFGWQHHWFTSSHCYTSCPAFSLIDIHSVEQSFISLHICSTHPESLHGSLLLMLLHIEIVKMLNTLQKIYHAVKMHYRCFIEKWLRKRGPMRFHLKISVDTIYTSNKSIKMHANV